MLPCSMMGQAEHNPSSGGQIHGGSMEVKNSLSTPPHSPVHFVFEHPFLMASSRLFASQQSLMTRFHVYFSVSHGFLQALYVQFALQLLHRPVDCQAVHGYHKSSAAVRSMSVRRLCPADPRRNCWCMRHCWRTRWGPAG